MTTNQYDYVLSMFISDDKDRPNMNNIFPDEDYYCATDSFVLCIVPQKLVGGQYEKVEQSPNALKVLNSYSFNQENKINKAFLLENLSSVEWVYRNIYKECEECDGTGEIECKCCGNENDCKDCDGTGESNNVIPFSKMELKGEKILFLGKKFAPNNLNKVLLSAYILEAEDITCKWSDERGLSPILFEIKDCKILVMPKI